MCCRVYGMYSQVSLDGIFVEHCDFLFFKSISTVPTFRHEHTVINIKITGKIPILFEEFLFNRKTEKMRK